MATPGSFCGWTFFLTKEAEAHAVFPPERTDSSAGGVAHHEQPHPQIAAFPYHPSAGGFKADLMADPGPGLFHLSVLIIISFEDFLRA
jgi:hypothetical protein